VFDVKLFVVVIEVLFEVECEVFNEEGFVVEVERSVVIEEVCTVGVLGVFSVDQEDMMVVLFGSSGFDEGFSFVYGVVVGVGESFGGFGLVGIGTGGGGTG
jgi:hypothetical protein